MTLQQVQQTTVSVVTGAASAWNSGAFIEHNVDLSTNKPPTVQPEFRITCNFTGSNGFINVYCLPIGVDDTNYPEDLDSGWEDYFVGSRSYKDGTATEQLVILPEFKPPYGGKFRLIAYHENDGTPVAISSGYDLDLVPGSFNDV